MGQESLIISFLNFFVSVLDYSNENGNHWANYFSNRNSWLINYNANLLFLSKKKNLKKEVKPLENTQIKDYINKINEKTRNKIK